MRNSTMEYKVNQAYEELKRLIQWHPDSEEKFLQKMERSMECYVFLRISENRK